MNNIAILEEKEDDHYAEKIEVSKRIEHLVKINNTKSNYDFVNEIRRNAIFHLDREENSNKKMKHPTQYPSTLGNTPDEQSESSILSSLLLNEARSDI